MKHVIITAANGKVGDFVVNHWYLSLRSNVNLTSVDVVVFDYGLTAKQKKKLKDNGVKVIAGGKKYHIVNKRFIDAGKYLQKHKYDQVLFVDSSDVIFQSDLTEVFGVHKDCFRVVTLGDNVLFVKALVYDQFKPESKKKIWSVIKNKPIINAGVIFAPRKKFIELCDDVGKMIRDKDQFGPDQVVVNYHIYQSKVRFIDTKYNFTMNSAYSGFKIVNGIFYKYDGEKIVIVHNCGQSDMFRPIKNFGYGKGFNQIKPVMYFLKRLMYFCFEFYHRKSFVKNTTK